jgi:hypothetical protein
MSTRKPKHSTSSHKAESTPKANRQRCKTKSKDRIDFETISSPENTGLAMAAEIESKNDGDSLCTTTVALMQSPMFRQAVVDYGRNPEALAAVMSSNPSDEEYDRSFMLRQLCGRMFRAGVMAGRNERSYSESRDSL